jgi:Lrp/AsnC family transcriptional regulator, leucine-responsive regulatory protein
MDDVDRKLLAALRTNARSTYAELGRQVGLSAPAVHERVGKLETSGVITGYHAAIAPEALGYAVNALIGIFITDSADTEEIADSLAAQDQVEDCWFVAGEETFIVKVCVPDVGGLEKIIRDLNAVPGIARTRTTVVLSTKFEDRVHP